MRSSLALVITFAFATNSFAQSTPEPLKGADRTAYEDLKNITKPEKRVIVETDEKATAENRRILTAQAKYLVGRLMDTTIVNKNDWSRVIEDAIARELPIVRVNKPKEYNEKYLEFAREMGNIMIKELEPAIKSPKLGVRVNAARMLSVVGLMGCPKSAELALKVLQDDQENDAVKFYCLETLDNVFAFMPDQTLPEQSVFQVKDRAKKDERELERTTIKYLCDYVLKERDVGNKSPVEIAAIKYVRRKAVEALGHVRTHRVRHQGQTIAYPGLVLLKVANKDGIVPVPELKERAEAVVGYCQMFPVVRANVDRDIQLDYAAGMLAAAILDIVNVKVTQAADISLPWVVTGHRFEAALKLLQDNSANLNLTNAAVAKKLHDQTKSDLLEALKANQGGVAPNAQQFRTWLQGNPPKSTSLYQGEPNTTVKPINN